MKKISDIPPSKNDFFSKDDGLPKKEIPSVSRTEQKNGMFFPILNLPSNGNVYPPETVIEARGLTYREIKKLGYMTSKNSSFIMDEISKSAIRGIDDLCEEDLLYCYLIIRSHTMTNPIFDISFQCTNEECGAMNPFGVHPADLEIKKLEKRAEEFNFELDDGSLIEFQIPKMSRRKELDTFLEKEAIDIEDWDDDDDTADATAGAYISKIDGKSVTIREAWEKIQNLMNPDSVIKILKTVEQLDFGPSPTTPAKCSKCGKEHQIVLDFGDLFFFSAI